MRIEFKGSTLVDIAHLSKKYNHFEHTDFYSDKEMFDLEFKLEDGNSIKLLSDCENAHNEPYGIKPNPTYYVGVIQVVSEGKNQEMTIGEFIEGFASDNMNNQVIIDYRGEQGLLTLNSPKAAKLNSLFTLQDMEGARYLNSTAEQAPLIVFAEEGENVVKMTVDQFME